MRYFLEVAYDGGNYHGWQSQQNTPRTIQGILEDALSKILGTPTPIVGSGRTDTGVHCRKQFAHFETEHSIHERDLTHHLNSFLPPQIAIKNILKAKQTAHARFDAYLRIYHYHLVEQKTPFSNGYAYYHRKKGKLDFEKMNHAAKILLQHTDFESFSKVKTEVKHFDCQITEAIWSKENNGYTEYWGFTISANRFLRGMVRAIVGTLLLVGEGKINIKDFEEIILKKDRRAAGSAAEPQGLFLVDVQYPEDIFL